MSLPRTPTQPSVSAATVVSTADPANVPITNPEHVCKICSENMDDKTPCMVINRCNHIFHRICIENSLSNAKECPVCFLTCELEDVRTFSFHIKQNPNRPRGKARGAVSKTYNTRSVSKNLFQDPTTPHNNTTGGELINPRTPPQQNVVPSGMPCNDRNNPQIIPQSNSPSLIDYNRINRMIESSVSKALQSLNLSIQNPRIQQQYSSGNSNLIGSIMETDIQQVLRNLNCNNSANSANNQQYQLPNSNENNPGNIPMLTHQNRPQNIYNSFPNSNHFNRQPSTMRTPSTNCQVATINTDKITSIIQNWCLKFDGSTTGLTVEEFLYRLTSLTNDNFNGDYTIICKNLHILLSGKARDWFWRYHKQERGVIDWSEFCNAIRSQYKDFKSSFDLREEIRNRRQKPGESFDVFYDSISAIMDRLPSAFSEMELIEIIMRNLRPDIRQDLLYIPVHSIPHLRKLVQIRESFLEDEHVKRNLHNRTANAHQPRRHIAEVDLDSVDANPVGSETSIDALHNTPTVTRCWNCDRPGHVWEDCLYERTIFCYGCGAKNTYRPQCPKCKDRKWENYYSRRNKIFKDVELASLKRSKPKRSTIRLNNYYRKRKICSKLLLYAILSDPKDNRFYAKVSFIDYVEYGLLDTGASISCIGSELAKEDFSKFPNFTSCRNFVKTADGAQQRVIGWLNVNITFKEMSCPINLFVIPTISQRLILGIDFWKKFKLVPNVMESADLCDKLSVSASPSVSSDKSESLSEVCGKSDCEKSDDNYMLTSSQQQQLNAVISLFPNFEKQGLGRTGLIKHLIDVGEARPIKQRFYPVSPAVEKLMFTEIDRMLTLGVIEPSNSPWSSPMRLVIKPNKVRLCLDARKVNSVTKKDAYPLPSIEGIFARLPKANIISKLDLKDAYWQIALDDESKPITAFTVPGRPLYQFTVMPFGLCNAPQTMSRLIDELIPPDLKNSVFGYLDDVIIVSENFEEHIGILIRIAGQFRKANLTLNLSKSKFCVTKVKYLGYIIGDGGIVTDPEKVSAIRNWPTPKNIKQVRGFLGLAGWYRRFIANFSSVVYPISETLSTKKKFVWTPEAQQAFEQIKDLLSSAPILSNPDFEKKFFVHCDASDFGIGAVLVQLDNNNEEKPIAFMSRKLNSAQRNYSVTERECLAAIEAIQRFRCYLELQKFEVITDHSSLVWLMKQPNLSGRLARWALKLQAYNFTISHRKGKENIVPDALSRIEFGEVNSLDSSEPEIDLNSTCFDDPDYCDLKNRIHENQSQFPDIKVVEKYVYIRTEHYDGIESNESEAWKLWIPYGLRTTLIKRFHDPPTVSHGGMSKTLELLRRKFYWPGMVVDVRNFVRSCELCKTTKHPNFVLKPEMGKQTITIRPFQRLYIDLLGPYPRSKKGNIGILIVLDHLSKFQWLQPLKKFTSSSIKDFLETQIFHVYGIPETIVSDNGSQFRANDLNAYFTSLGIKHIYTAVYSPQSNASERVNRSIIAAIRAFLKHEHTKWDENLSAINCALRNGYHQSINMSPYHVVFGFNMITHGSAYALLNNLKTLNEPTASLSRDDHLQLIRKDIQKYLNQAYKQNQRTYNLRTRPEKFHIGQEVLRRNFVQSNMEKRFNAKFAPLFVKATVKEKLGNHYYVLTDSDGKIVGTYHAKDIRT
ncbi:uncharacterized protein LOC135960632 [Calliphora vicina]|uniref:uncharacterized protein LOC135960632 n=1 Tax=Calliphora vicina TaxID=7373 RepID=UPI00325B92D2